jgi:hypothetical protein
LTAPDIRNPMQTVIAIWRGILDTFYRLPLLVLGSFLLYVLVSGYWQHSLPFYIPRGLASQAGYELLHAIVFAPLVLAVIQMIARPNIRHADIWIAAAIWVGAVILVRELAIQLEIFSWRVVRSDMINWLFARPYGRGGASGSTLIFEVVATINLALFLGVFLLSMRLALLLPIVALEEIDWKAALAKAWRDMSGSYGFALVVACAAVLPLLVADYFLTQLYRVLYDDNSMPVSLSLREWEALMVRSLQLTLGYIMTAAIAAWLYRVIADRRATAPSPSHMSPAHRPGF